MNMSIIARLSSFMILVFQSSGKLYGPVFQDTAWLSFHGMLPTSDCLVCMRMFVSPLCFCQQPETLIHLFVTCLFAREIFFWFLSQFRKFNQVAALTSGGILFGYSSSSCVPVVFTVLLGVLRHHIWLTRNWHCSSLFHQMFQIPS
jgi:hypothetical protein